jgi:diguanylate cyclase (GGDEF)-like protein
MKSWSSYSILALIGAVLLFAVVGVSSLVSIRRQSADAEWVEHTHEVLEQIETTLRYATEARRGATGYVATGDLARLRSCYDAQHATAAAVERLRDLTRDNPGQQARIRQLQQLLVDERAGFDLVSSTRSVAVLQTPAWKDRFVVLSGLIDAMKGQELHLLAVRNREEEASVQGSEWIVAGGDLIAFALMIASVLVPARENRQRRLAEMKLSAANQELTGRVSDLQRRSAELALLSRLGQLLHSCESREEVGAIVRSLFPQLFPGSRGAVFWIAASRSIVTPVAAWPESEEEPLPFAPSECWALRTGALHQTSLDPSGLLCKHASGEKLFSAICVPLIAHGEALGLLHVRFSTSERPPLDVAGAVAEQLSLASANLAMQETLRRQAMRDPLTGLFNRRYMEETLEREIHRAVRQKSLIGVLLIDLDHFKQYNDTLGHFAGDDLLRTAGTIMQRAVRAEDVVCRYGGDEFVVIMPDTAANVVEQRANSLHEALGQLPGPVTASIGLALYPSDASSGKALLESADSALYQAKRSGRARVARATSPDAAASRP